MYTCVFSVQNQVSESGYYFIICCVLKGDKLFFLVKLRKYRIIVKSFEKFKSRNTV